MNDLLKLFIVFFKISLFCPGGGATMMPLLLDDLCEKRKWFTTDEIAEGYALSQSMPGPIAVNTAIYFGEKKLGIKGAFAAMSGSVIPAIVSIVLIVWLIDKFKLENAIALILSGIKSASIALICASLIKMIKNGVKNKADFALLIGLVVITLILNVSAYYTVLLAVLFGIIAYVIGMVRSKKNAGS